MAGIICQALPHVDHSTVHFLTEQQLRRPVPQRDDHVRVRPQRVAVLPRQPEEWSRTLNLKESLSAL
jgi:hypothetical protein